MDRIGVRELRQHASRYLARVATGESFEVTDRGRSVAMLVPTPSSHRDLLIATGQLLPAVGQGDLLDLPPEDFGVNASAELEVLRRDER